MDRDITPVTSVAQGIQANDGCTIVTQVLMGQQTSRGLADLSIELDGQYRDKKTTIESGRIDRGVSTSSCHL